MCCYIECIQYFKEKNPMTHAGIQCFLAICQNKTGSKAAEALYITQSSLSTRLKTLEKELDITLFYRKKGSREMVLTEAGKLFYPLALQHEKLMQQMQQISHSFSKTLRVSSFNSLGTYFLPEICDLFLQNYPQFQLEMQDMEMDAAQQSLQNNTTDLAFTCGKTNSSSLKQTPVFQESMVIISSAAFPIEGPVTPKQLSQYTEIYVEWTHSFAQWHHHTFDQEGPQIRVSIMAHLQKYIQQESCWAIVPISVANGLSQNCRIHRIPSAFPLPERKVSIMTLVGSFDNPAIQAFWQCTQHTLNKHAEFCTLISAANDT